MDAIRFRGSNVVYAEKQEDYNNLPAFQSEEGNVVICIEVTDDDLIDIANNRKIWISLLTFGGDLQPIRVESKRPVDIIGE